MEPGSQAGTGGAPDAASAERRGGQGSRAVLGPNDEGEPSRFLPDYLLFQLAMASAAASAGFHAIARTRGLKVPEWRVLACLSDADGQMVTRLAQLALMEQSRLTRVIERMVEAGLVRRETGPEDRRQVLVWLTEAGRALARQMVAEARRHEAGLLTALGEADAAELKRLLGRLAEVARDEGDQLAAPREVTSGTPRRPGAAPG